MTCRCARGRAPKQDDGGSYSTAERQESPEVGVRRDQNARLTGCTVKDLVISRRLESILADMNGIVTGLPQTFGYRGQHRVVDEESHRPGTRGISRSRTASAA